MKEVNFGTITKIRLNSYHPLCSNTFGQLAIKKYQLNPYIDGSCRREPDLENPFPSITALCRQNSFATKLWPNSVIVYISLGDTDLKNPNYRLIAILKASKRFDNHFLASRWYRENNISIPSNCLIPTNDPQPFDKTISKFTNIKGIEHFLQKDAIQQEIIGQRTINSWDREYQEKSERWPTFIVTKPKFNAIAEDIEPPIITEADFLRIMGKIPNTRTPNKLAIDQLKDFCEIAGIQPRITSH